MELDHNTTNTGGRSLTPPGVDRTRAEQTELDFLEVSGRGLEAEQPDDPQDRLEDLDSDQ